MLNLTDHTRVQSEIVAAVLDARGQGDHRAFAFTPADPLPARQITRLPTPDGFNVHAWDQEEPTFAHVKRVQNWGWLRRQACGYGVKPSLVHPAVGTAFSVRQWRYAKTSILGPGNAPMGPIPHERFDPILIARLSDGRIFADQWADSSVLWSALDRWRNARGYLCDWQGIAQDPPTCAIGGLDWRAIPAAIDAQRARARRERDLAA